VNLRHEIAEAKARGSTHMVVTCVRAKEPRTMPGSMGVFLARPRILGKYLGPGHGPVSDGSRQRYAYDVSIADLERLR